LFYSSSSYHTILQERAIIMNSIVVVVVCSVALLSVGTDAFSMPDSMSRRQSVEALIGGVTTAVVTAVIPAFADDEEVAAAPAPAAETPPAAVEDTPPAPVVSDEHRAIVEAEIPPVVVEETVPPAPVVVEKPKYKTSLTEADAVERSTTRMGGLLEAFQDGPRSIRMMVPSGWNKFEGEVGAYDIKWQDVVDKAENIKISSTPVKSTTTSIDVLGDVKTVGAGLAQKRGATLVSAEERLTDGILFYKFSFAIKGDKTHQLLQLCICKGKLWSIDASSTERRWQFRAPLYENVFASFMPKLA